MRQAPALLAGRQPRRMLWCCRSAALLGALLLSLLLLPRAAGAAGEFPAFSNYVVDEAGVVPDEAERQVDASLGDYQMRSGNQVAVAVVRTTGVRSIEAYSLALANTWGVGQKGKDNGVVVVIAYEDRRVRLEVGRGLAKSLTDQRAAGIINDGLVQRLGRRDVGGAVIFATNAIRRALGDTQVTGDGAPPGPDGLAPGLIDPRLLGLPMQPPLAPDRPEEERRRGTGEPLRVVAAALNVVLITAVAIFGVPRTRVGARWMARWARRPRRSRGRNGTSSGGTWWGSSGSGSFSGGGDFGGGGGGGFDGGGSSGSW